MLRSLELGDVTSVPQSMIAVSSEATIDAVRIDAEIHGAIASGVGSDTSRTNLNPDGSVHSEDTEISTQNEVMIPYSVQTGLLVFCVFVISFVVIMVIRGVVVDVPRLFKFFANIYLAGICATISIC